MVTNEDLEMIDMTGGFAGMSYAMALRAIMQGTTNYVDSKGNPLPEDPERTRVDREYYLGLWANQVMQTSFAKVRQIADQSERRHAALMRDAYSASGVTPQEYAYAKLEKVGGDESPMLRIYSKFLERC